MKSTFLNKLASFCTGKSALFLLLITILAALPLAVFAAEGDALETVLNASFGVVLSPVTVLAWLSFKIASFLLGIAGIFFNWTVAVLVFDFGKYFGNSTGLLLGWSVLRDFANIGLLFGFVFMGIATILDLHSYPWKKSLPMLVIFAILLNFSLFVTEAIIDSTNAVSTILFEQSFEPAGCRAESWLDCVINTGVAGAILTNANIATAYNGEAAGTLLGDVINTASGVIQQFVDPVGNTMKFIALAILMSVAATVFFAAAGLFLSRGIMLAFLMVTSPIGFAGMAVPFLHGLAEKWWHELLHQSFFAPVFLLLLLVGLKITESLTTISGTGNLSTIFESRNVVDTGALLVFFLAIGFFVAALMIAKQFGIKMADTIIEKTGSKVGSLAFGTAASIGRNTMGKFSSNAANRINLSPLGRTMVGRRLLWAANQGTNASMDIRGGSGLKVGGISLGKASDAGKKGFKGVQDANAKIANEQAKARKAAWASQDKAFGQEVEDLKRKVDLARANKNEGAAQKYEKQILDITKKKGEKLKDGTIAAEDGKWEKAKIARLTGDERKLYKAYGKVPEPKAEERDAETKLATAATEFANATTRLATAATQLAEAQRKQKDAYASGDVSSEGTTRYDGEVRAAELENQRLAEEKEHWRKENEDADKQLNELRKIREANKEGRERADKLVKPEQAMEQLARAYANAARTPGVGTVLDSDRLRGMADAIRKDKGKSHTDHLFEELHELVGHGAGHGKEGGDDHGGGHGSAPAGGGGGKPKAAAHH